MKKIMALAAMAALAAAPFAAKAAFEDITTERYPDADCVIADSIDDTAYNPDGTYVSASESWVKVLTEKGRQEESVQSVRFNARYGKASFDFVRIIGADGVEREVDVSATTKETTDNSSASSNIYDPMSRKIVCTIPGLKVGETVHYKTRRETTKPRVEGVFSNADVMEWTIPFVRSVVTIKSPAELPLAKMAVRHPLGNVVESHERQPDGSVLHTWTATNSPQAFPEPDAPPLHTQIQNVRVSTASDWREISRWYWNLSLPHLEKTNEAMTNQVEAIGRDIAKIYKWVSQEVRYMGLTLEDTSPGYAPHDVNVTFDNRYGVCRDKAGLLVAMLRMAGFDAFPVLIHSGAKMDDEVPLPYFNHAIVAVCAPGDARANKDGFILMDPTDESSRDLLPAYLSNCSYLVATPKGEGLHTSQVPPASGNSLRVVSRGVLEKDGSLVMNAELCFLGLNDNIYRRALLKRTPEDRRKFFERVVRNVAPGAELVSCDITPADLRETETELSARIVFRAPESLLEGETRDELVVPMVSRALGAANWMLDGSTSLEKRRFPLVMDSTAMVEEECEIELGGAVGAALSVPEAMSIEGGYGFSRSFEAKDGKLVAKRTLAVNAVEFSPEEYLELRENIKRVEAAERERAVFGKDALADADVRVRFSSSDYSFTGENSWVVTNTVVKEILTYNGKKSSSELTFGFNPLVKSVELVSAVVSNADGRVASVGAKEMNEFDCGWAASAPRYPASRKLVVNLPSVEIGSVISYTWVATVTDSPVPFRSVWCFDTSEPVDEMSVRVRAWPLGEVWERRERNPKRIPRENMQPDAILWRDCEVVSKGDFESAAKNLSRAADVAPLREGEAYEAALAANGAEAKAVAVRDWMAKHVRVRGPSLYEVPLESQLTDPAVVMKERYGTRLDYVRAMCAAMKGAGLDADIVFAAGDAGSDPRVSLFNLVKYPNVGMFASALCRVRVREGGFLWWGGRRATYYVGTENEYAPLGATPFAKCHFLDPSDGAVGLVDAADEEFRSNGRTTYDIEIRPNGAVDVRFESLSWGSGVGDFRKGYAEMLPEDRSRHYQSVLGALAQAATATGPLVTDTESYPARLAFNAFVPDYAVVKDGTVTINLPMLGANLFPLTGTVRKSPIGIGGKNPGETVVKVTFPEGYTVAEHLPEGYSFANPETPEIGWYDFSVKTAKDEKGRLVVTMARTTKDCDASSAGRDYFALLKDWSRISASRANRTVVVRRPAKE